MTGRRHTIRPRRQNGRRGVSYARVAAVLALFFSLSSGALAARHYLITSTRQIRPRVLSALRARRGPAGIAGAPGLQGAKGPAGDAGAQGPVGPAPAVLAPGQTETGVWGGSTVAENGPNRYRVTASFPIALADPIPEGLVGYEPQGAPPNPACPGVGRAAPGFLCLYEGRRENLVTPSQAAVFDPEEFEGPAQSAGRSGFAIELSSADEGATSVTGTFAVTAPRSAERIEFLARGRLGAAP